MFTFFVVLIIFLFIIGALSDDKNKSGNSTKNSSSSSSKSTYHSRTSSPSVNNDFKPITHNTDFHSRVSEIAHSTSNEGDADKILDTFANTNQI